MTYTKTYLVPEDPGWANGCLRWKYVESEEYHENEFYLWNNKTKSYDKVTDEEYEIVSDAFDELLDSMEYDEIVSEDELN